MPVPPDPVSHSLGELAQLDDPVAAMAGLARLRAGLFDHAPTGAVRLDRYLLVERLSAGGFGTVYRAYDPQLDRHVALKLIEVESGATESDAQERLLDEARVLAGLSHPHVIRIYDAGKYEPQQTFALPEAAASMRRAGVFLVLELVPGTTLETSADDGVRGWRESLDLYLQAGEGLAAAHAEGILHLDFKPANAIVGQDGRVRVIDFGLARAIDRRPAEDLDVEAGTPLYSPPEPWAQLDAQADQFSFCASLFEALHGVTPFAGRTVEALRRAKRDGAVVQPAPSGDVPVWVHDAVVRGLSPDPAQRWPSMLALLDALRPKTPRAWPWAVAVGGAAVVAMALGLESRPSPVCPRADQVLAQTWDSPRRTRIKSALLATGAPYAATAWNRVDRRMHEYLATWQSDWRTACAAGDAALTSDRRERATACLLSRRRRLVAMSDLLVEADAALAARAVDIIDEVEISTSCLGQGHAPPLRDPDTAERYEQLAGAEDRLRVMSHADRHDDALQAGERALALARELEDPGREALAKLHLASIATHGVRPRESVDGMVEALAMAIQHRAADVEARAWINLLTDRPRAGEVLISGPVLDAMATAAVRRTDDDPELRRLLLHNLATNLVLREQFSAALPMLEELYDELEPDDRMVSAVRINLAIVEAELGRRAHALELLDIESDWRYERYGPNHPSLAYTWSNYGTILNEVGMWDAAREAYLRALELRRISLGPDHPELVAPLCGVAETSLALRDLASAHTHADECLRVALAAWGPGHLHLQRPLLMQTRIAETEGKHFEALSFRWQMVDVAAAAYPVGSAVVASRRADLARRMSEMFMKADAGRLVGQVLAAPLELDNSPNTAPQRARARINLALTYDNLGVETRAQTALRYALEHPDVRSLEAAKVAVIWFRLARITANNGDTATGVRHANRALGDASPALRIRIERWLAAR